MARTVTFTITADASTAKIQACRLGRTSGAGAQRPELLSPVTKAPYLEANSEEFTAGDMVNLVSGEVSKVLTGDNEPIAGFALTDATNVTSGNAEIRVFPVNAQDEYIMNVADATAADTDMASVVALIGGAYDLAQATVTNLDGSTTYCTVVSLDAATDARVVITGIAEDPTITASTQYIPVYVKFLPFGMVSGDPTYQGLQFP